MPESSFMSIDSTLYVYNNMLTKLRKYLVCFKKYSNQHLFWIRKENVLARVLFCLHYAQLQAVCI